MKRKLVMLLTIVAVLAVGIGIWYNVPINLMDLEHDEVIEIVVFNGNTGNATHITDETQIEHIIENLNEIKLKRSKPSVGYSGYSFKMTIYLSDGNEADDWNNFIINSDDMRRDRQHSGGKAQRLRRFPAKTGAAGIRGQARKVHFCQGRTAETIHPVPHFGRRI